jgi:CheY-like chemotaxis protein
MLATHSYELHWISSGIASPLMRDRASSRLYRSRVIVSAMSGLGDADLDGHAADLVAWLAGAGPTPRMGVVGRLEGEGHGFHEALSIVAHGVSRGWISRARGGALVAAEDGALRAHRRILLVDDALDVRAGVAETLRAEGYLVCEASDGIEAIEALLEGAPPSLMLLDLLMPRATGWEVLGWLGGQTRLAAMKVIVFSGIGDEVRVSGVRMLPKPIDTSDLLGAVGDALRA